MAEGIIITTPDVRLSEAETIVNRQIERVERILEEQMRKTAILLQIQLDRAKTFLNQTKEQEDIISDNASLESNSELASNHRGTQTVCNIKLRSVTCQTDIDCYSDTLQSNQVSTGVPYLNQVNTRNESKLFNQNTNLNKTGIVTQINTVENKHHHKHHHHKQRQERSQQQQQQLTQQKQQQKQHKQQCHAVLQEIQQHHHHQQHIILTGTQMQQQRQQAVINETTQQQNQPPKIVQIETQELQHNVILKAKTRRQHQERQRALEDKQQQRRTVLKETQEQHRHAILLKKKPRNQQQRHISLQTTHEQQYQQQQRVVKQTHEQLQQQQLVPNETHMGINIFSPDETTNKISGIPQISNSEYHQSTLSVSRYEPSINNPKTEKTRNNSIPYEDTYTSYISSAEKKRRKFASQKTIHRVGYQHISGKHKIMSPRLSESPMMISMSHSSNTFTTKYHDHGIQRRSLTANESELTPGKIQVNNTIITPIVHSCSMEVIIPSSYSNEKSVSSTCKSVLNDNSQQSDGNIIDEMVYTNPNMISMIGERNKDVSSNVTVHNLSDDANIDDFVGASVRIGDSQNLSDNENKSVLSNLLQHISVEDNMQSLESYSYPLCSITDHSSPYEDWVTDLYTINQNSNYPNKASECDPQNEHYRYVMPLSSNIIENKHQCYSDSSIVTTTMLNGFCVTEEPAHFTTPQNLGTAKNVTSQFQNSEDDDAVNSTVSSVEEQMHGLELESCPDNSDPYVTEVCSVGHPVHELESRIDNSASNLVEVELELGTCSATPYMSEVSSVEHPVHELELESYIDYATPNMEEHVISNDHPAYVQYINYAHLDNQVSAYSDIVQHNSDESSKLIHEDKLTSSSIIYSLLENDRHKNNSRSVTEAQVSEKQTQLKNSSEIAQLIHHTVIEVSEEIDDPKDISSHFVLADVHRFDKTGDNVAHGDDDELSHGIDFVATQFVGALRLVPETNEQLNTNSIRHYLDADVGMVSSNERDDNTIPGQYKGNSTDTSVDGLRNDIDKSNESANDCILYSSRAPDQWQTVLSSSTSMNHHTCLTSLVDHRDVTPRAQNMAEVVLQSSLRTEHNLMMDVLCDDEVEPTSNLPLIEAINQHKSLSSASTSNLTVCDLSGNRVYYPVLDLLNETSTRWSDVSSESQISYDSSQILRRQISIECVDDSSPDAESTPIIDNRNKNTCAVSAGHLLMCNNHNDGMSESTNNSTDLEELDSSFFERERCEDISRKFNDSINISLNFEDTDDYSSEATPVEYITEYSCSATSSFPQSLQYYKDIVTPVCYKYMLEHQTEPLLRTFRDKKKIKRLNRKKTHAISRQTKCVNKRSVIQQSCGTSSRDCKHETTSRQTIPYHQSGAICIVTECKESADHNNKTESESATTCLLCYETSVDRDITTTEDMASSILQDEIDDVTDGDKDSSIPK